MMLLTYYEYIFRQFCQGRWDDIVNEANCVAKQNTILAQPLFVQYECKGLPMEGMLRSKVIHHHIEMLMEIMDQNLMVHGVWKGIIFESFAWIFVLINEHTEFIKKDVWS